MWKQLKAFVLVTLGISAFAEGNLELSDEDQQKLDAAAKQEGFAARFMAKYNDELEAKDASAAIDAFMKENDIDASASSENGEEDETGTEIPKDDASLDAKVKALMKEVSGVKAENKELKGNIAKLEKLPDAETAPETITANLSKMKISHSKTHLFASNNQFDAFADRPWNQATKQALAGLPITAATDWTQTANIDKLNADIQDYFRKDPQMIHTTMLDGLEMKKYVELISGVSDEYLHTSIVTGEITQSLKKKFLPKNKVKFEVEKGKVRDIQIDMLFEGYELKKLEKSYLKNIAALGITDSNPHKMRFVMYVVTEIMKRARKEDKIVMGRGVYFADPNRNTPASFMNNFSGFLKKYKDARGVKYRAFKMGKPTPENIHDYVKTMCERLPYDVRILPDMQYVLSPTWKRRYNEARKLKYGGNTDYNGDTDNVDDFSNIELVTYDQMEGEDFMYITTKDNEYALTDKPGEDGFIQFVKSGDNPRNIKAFGDYKLGTFVAVFGRKQDDLPANSYENQLVFSNDVEVLVDSYIPVAANDATPSLALHHSIVVGANNTAATNITAFDDITPGERIYVLGNADANRSTIKNGTNIILEGGADFTLSNGDLMVLQGLEGGKAIEISRKTVGDDPEPEVTILAPDATTADAADGTSFVTSENTQATALTTIENAVSGERYTITGGGGTTNATTIANSGNFFLTGAVTLTDGTYITVEYTGSKFVETARG